MEPLRQRFLQRGVSERSQPRLALKVVRQGPNVGTCKVLGGDDVVAQYGPAVRRQAAEHFGVELPNALEPAFSENVRRLPRAFQPSDNTRVLEPVPSREDCGLPAQGVVLCCFNNSYKLNPRSVQRLFAVLQGVPGSVLWLLSGPGNADARLRSAARQAQLDPARLVFMPRLPHPQYLARYQHADLFLDTHPYNAHTTASDALWAGCPVLTCPGTTFASRVASSLNHHLGMHDFNVADDAAFVATAIQLGNDPAALQAARATLAQRREASGLFDMAGFARDLTEVIQTLARERGWQGPHIA